MRFFPDIAFFPKCRFETIISKIVLCVFGLPQKRTVVAVITVVVVLVVEVIVSL